MSQETIELVHRAYDAFNRRDLDAFLDLCDPEVEFTSARMLVEGGEPYHGHDGIRDWWDGLFSIVPDFESEIVEARDLGDFAVCQVRVHGHGVGSGAPMDQTFWQAAEVRGGRAVWWHFVRTEPEALEAVESRG
jgi:ketosteroid isomerase-like protein